MISHTNYQLPTVFLLNVNKSTSEQFLQKERREREREREKYIIQILLVFKQSFLREYMKINSQKIINLEIVTLGARNDSVASNIRYKSSF